MDYSPWIAVAVSILVFLVGCAVQAVTIAFFLGRLKSDQSAAKELAQSQLQANKELVGAFQLFIQKTVDALLARMSSLDQFASDSSADRSQLDARLKSVERNTDGLQKLREEFSALRQAVEINDKHGASKLDAISRDLQTVQRQIATISSQGFGRVLELPATKEGQQ